MACIHIWPLWQEQVLTRRDQQLMKAEKQKQKQKKDNEKDGKSKGGAKTKGESKPEETAAPEAKAEPKRKSRARKPKAEVPEEDDAEAVEVKDDKEEVQETKPRKTRAPKAKAKASPKKAAVKEKAKAKSKAKAKAKSKSQQKGKKEIEDEDSASDDEQEIATPRRKLFESDGEGEEEEEPPRNISKQNDKKRKVLEALVEESKPKDWKRSKKGTVKTASGASPEVKRGRGKKADLSPFAKKEVARRKKKETEIMQMEGKEDDQIQGLCRQHLKAVQPLTFDDLKKYLSKSVENKFDHFYLNPYWTRPACGVKHVVDGSSKSKAPELVYFGKFGTAKTHNDNMALQYVAASLMATWLRLLWENWFF